MTLILPQPTDTTKSKSHSKLHRVFAVDNGASDQTVVANANNSITVNSTVLANSFVGNEFVGNLIGNASTVTNGVYKNTNNTFTANNTFTGSVVVPNATSNTNPVALGQFSVNVISTGITGTHVIKYPATINNTPITIIEQQKEVDVIMSSSPQSWSVTLPETFPNAILEATSQHTTSSNDAMECISSIISATTSTINGQTQRVTGTYVSGDVIKLIIKSKGY